MTLGECYIKVKQLLKNSGIEDYNFDAKQLVKFITKYDSSMLLKYYDSEIDSETQKRLEYAAIKRSRGYPLQYILGEWDFYGLRFFVTEGCLVPRSDTETLVGKALEFLKDKKNARVIDLCAGSGCVGITVANICKDSRVCLLEKYSEAFNCLKKNAECLAAENTELIKADVFTFVPKEKYDIVLCNPPYISDDERPLLNSEAKCEPETAFFGGKDGLDYYRAIIPRYRKFLKKDGMIAFEVGFKQAEKVKMLLSQNGFYKTGSEKDLSGIERVVFGTVK